MCRTSHVDHIRKYTLLMILVLCVLACFFPSAIYARKKKKKPKGALFLADMPSFVGESAYDNAGLGLQSVGDVNGDGLDDFAVGSPNNDEGDENTGKVYLYFGVKAKEREKGEKLINAPVVFIGENKRDNAGITVSAAGDVNGDGLADFIIAARNNHQGGEGAGKVYLVFGKKDGWEKKNSLSEVFPVFIGEMEEDNIGSTLSAAGDINGDGYSDFLIGTSKNDEGGEDAGAAYIIWGHGGKWKKYNRLSRMGTKLIGEAAYDQTGSALSMAGDLNGDGYDDIVVGSEKEAEGGKSAGSVYILMGKKGKWPRSIDLSRATMKISGTKPKAKFGFSASFIGDINGDGYSDLGVGAPASSKGMKKKLKKCGRLYIFLGKKDFFSTPKKKSTDSELVIVGDKKKTQFGYRVAYVADINNDGFDDFAVSSTRNSEWKNKGGKIYIFLGKKNWEKKSSAKTAQINIYGEAKRDYAGNTISYIGDISGSGRTGLLIGSDANSTGGRSAGKVYLVFPFKNTLPKKIKSFTFKRDRDFKHELDSDIGWGEELFIEAVTDDPDPSVRNKLPCVAVNSAKHRVKIYLTETEKNSGVYRGKISPSNTSSNHMLGRVSLSSGEQISVFPVSFPDYEKKVGLKVAFLSLDIDDDKEGNSDGNGNKRAELGERLELRATLINYNFRYGQGITAEIGTKSPNITIIKGESAYGDLKSGERASNESPFVVQVKKQAPDDFAVLFDLKIRSKDERIWRDSFLVHVEEIVAVDGRVTDNVTGEGISGASVAYGDVGEVLTDPDGAYKLYLNTKKLGNVFSVKALGYLNLEDRVELDISDKKAKRSFSLSKRENLNRADASFVGVDLHEAVGVSIGTGGDVNGDGYGDLLIGSWASNRGGFSAGSTYLVLGKKDGWGKRISLREAAASFIGEAPYDEAGRRVAITPDINGDGLDDILIGAPGHDAVVVEESGGSTIDKSYEKSGKIYIVFGRVTGWKHGVRLSEADSAFNGEAPYDRAGWALSGLGDVNGDGLNDIGIGAWSSTASGMDAGQSYIIFGRDRAWPKVDMLSISDASFLGEKSRDESGRFISGVGDVNGDGLDDFVIGAPASSSYKDFGGKVFLILGSKEDFGWRRSLASADASFLGEDANDSLGSAASYIGDVNGDGLDDFAIGAWGSDAAGKDAGKVYVIFGKKTGWKKNVKLSEKEDASFVGEKHGDAAGTSIAYVGDVNSDGYDDFSVSSPKNDFANPGSGQVYIVYGHGGKWEKNVKLSYAQKGFYGAETNDYAGFSLSNAGDLNNDGALDLVVSSWGDDSSGADKGQVFIFFGSGNRVPVELDSLSVSQGENKSDVIELSKPLAIMLKGRDMDPNHKDLATVVLNGSRHVFDFEVPLVETSNNSGVFLGDILLSESSANFMQRRMKLYQLDTLTVTSLENPSLYQKLTVKDDKGPFLRKIFPKPNSTNIPADINMSFHVRDYGCGVNENSIEIRVNGKVLKDVEKQKKRNNEIFVTSYADNVFDYGKDVKVAIKIGDLCRPANISNREYSFSVAPEGVFKNGGFEKGLWGWSVVSVPSISLAIDHKVMHSGKSSCRIKFTADADLYYDKFSSGPIPVRPKTKYSLIFWMKSEDITGNSGLRAYINGANHPDRYFNVNDYFEEQSEDLIETNEWTRMILPFSTLENTQYIILYMVRWDKGGVIKGTYWIDDFALYSENEAGYTTMGVFEGIRNLF